VNWQAGLYQRWHSLFSSQFYSNINDGEIQNRISKLGKKEKEQDDFALFQKFLEWKRGQK